MGDKTTIDLVQINSPGYLRGGKIFLFAAGFILIITGGCLVYQDVVLIIGRVPATTSNNILGNTILAMFFIGMGCAFITTLLAVGGELASTLVVSAGGFELIYPSGRKDAFYWNDPRLRVRFLDYIPRPGRLWAGSRRTILWQPFHGRSAIPPERLDQLCAEAERAGVRLSRRPYSPLSGTMILFSRHS